MPDADQPIVVRPDRGRCGTTLGVVLSAPGIDQASQLHVGDLATRITPAREPGQLRLELTIPREAAPGWREIVGTVEGVRRRWPSAFEVLPAGSAGGGQNWPGIGSHLI